MDELHAEGVLEGAGEDEVDELDGGRGEAVPDEARLKGLHMGGRKTGEVDVGGDVQVDDGALSLGGAPASVRLDDLPHPAVEPVGEADAL